MITSDFSQGVELVEITTVILVFRAFPIKNSQAKSPGRACTTVAPGYGSAIYTSNIILATFYSKERFKRIFVSPVKRISRLVYEKRTGAEMRHAITSGIVTGDAPVSYWSVCSPVPSNSPRGLCKI